MSIEDIKNSITQVIAQVKSIQEANSMDANDKLSALRDAGVTSIYYDIARSISLNIQATLDGINELGTTLDRFTQIEQLRSALACQIDSYRTELTTKMSRGGVTVCPVVKSYTPSTNYNVNALIKGNTNIANIENAINNI